MHDIAMTESYLIYIDKIENVTIDEKSNTYDEYLRLSTCALASTWAGAYWLSFSSYALQQEQPQ